MGAVAEDVRVVGTLAAANDTVRVSQPGTAVVTAQLTGTFVGTVVFEVDNDEGASPNWVAVNAQNVNTAAAVSSATAPGIFKIDAAGLRQVRVRCSAYTSGSIVVTLNASVAAAAPGLTSGGSAVSIADGSDAALGTTTDAKTVGDTNGTAISKLRGLSTILNDVWDSVNHWFQVKLMTGANVIGAVTQSGTWTVQPGNTANTTAWKVDNSAVTQPVSGTVSANATLQAGTATAGNVGGISAPVNATLTRPINTTTYTANTAVANATSAAAQITFSNAAVRSGGSGFVIGASILDEANQTLKGQFELWLFDTTMATVTNDNANWAPVNADLSNLVGVIKFDGGTVGNNAAGASGNVIFMDSLSKPLPYKCSGSANLFGQLVVRNAYVPVSAEVFVIRLDLSQDA